VRAVLREPDVHPAVARDAAGIQAALRALVEAAVEPLDVGSHEQRLTRAMVDVGTWTALRGQGLEPGETVAAVTAMLACRLERG
jgi:hypothetical protein